MQNGLNFGALHFSPLNKPQLCWAAPSFGRCFPQWIVISTLLVCNDIFNSSPPGQHDRHFTDIFKPIFLNENNRISFQFSLKIFLNGPIANKTSLVQVMASHIFGAKPLSEPMLTQFTDAYMTRGDELKIIANSLTIWRFDLYFCCGVIV